MAGTKELGDATKKLAKEKFKQWLETQMSDPKAVVFMIEQFDLAYDLILQSIEHGGMPTKGDVIRYLGAKANTFAGFSDSNQVACVSSIVTLGLTASTAPAAGVGGPVAWTWYVGAVVLDLLDAGGNCTLAYLDAKIGQDVEAFRKQIEARRAWGHANAVCTMKKGDQLANGLQAILDYRARQPSQLTTMP